MKISFYDFNKRILNGAGSDVCDDIFDMLNYMDSTGDDLDINSDDVDYFTLCTDMIAKELYLDDNYSAKDTSGNEVKLKDLNGEDPFILPAIIATIKTNKVVCVQITRWIWEHKDVFDKFMKEFNSESFQPYHIELFEDIDENFYDVYISTWLGIINGNYSEEDYKYLYDNLVKFQKNKNFLKNNNHVYKQGEFYVFLDEIPTYHYNPITLFKVTENLYLKVLKYVCTYSDSDMSVMITSENISSSVLQDKKYKQISSEEGNALIDYLTKCGLDELSDFLYNNDNDDNTLKEFLINKKILK